MKLLNISEHGVKIIQECKFSHSWTDFSRKVPKFAELICGPPTFGDLSNDATVNPPFFLMINDQYL